MCKSSYARRLHDVPDFYGRWLTRRDGGVVDESTTSSLSAEQIRRTAEWARFEQTADWHRRLARTIRDQGWYDAAIPHFDKAIELDPELAAARYNLGLALRKKEGK